MVDYVQIVSPLNCDVPSEHSNVKQPDKVVDHPYLQIVRDSYEPDYVEPGRDPLVPTSNGSTNHHYENETKPQGVAPYDTRSADNNSANALHVYDGEYLHTRAPVVATRYGDASQDLSCGEYLHAKTEGRRPNDELPKPPKELGFEKRAALTFDKPSGKRSPPKTPAPRILSGRVRVLIAVIVAFCIIGILAGIGYGIYYGVTHQSSGPATAPVTDRPTVLIYAELAYNDTTAVTVYRSNLPAFGTNFTTQMLRILSNSVLSNLTPNCSIINFTKTGLFVVSVVFNFHNLGNNTYIGLQDAIVAVINTFISGNVNIKLQCTAIYNNQANSYNCTSTN